MHHHDDASSSPLGTIFHVDIVRTIAARTSLCLAVLSNVRTSIRTWLAEATDAPHEVAEAMLSHATDSGVVRAYRQTDFLEQRLALTERWADYVTGGAGQVVKLVGAVN